MTRPTISFDLDGTLVQGSFGAVLRDILPDIGGGAEAYSEILRRHEELLHRHPCDAYDWLAITTSVTGAESDAVWRTLEAGMHGRSVSFVHDRTIEILTGLRESGWRSVVLTNGRRRFQVPVIAAAKLPVDELVTSDDVGATKPAAAMFAAARDGAKRHIHVGDRVDHDAAAANSAGATGVLLRADAPFASWTADLDLAGRRELERYISEVVAEEGTSEPDAPNARLDGVASSLANLRDLIGEP